MLAFGREMLTFLLTVLVALARINVNCFNLDTKFPIIFSGPERSYFGYTTAMIRNSEGHVLALVGAPRANFTIEPEVFEPGVLFRCQIRSQTCEQVDITFGRKELLWDKKTVTKYRMWFGGTLDVQPIPISDSHLNNMDIVVCAHRHYNPSTYSAGGTCYIFDRSFDKKSMKELNPLDKYDKLYIYDAVKSEYRSYFANGELGMSATFAEDGGRLLIGGPGIFEGTGSIYDYVPLVFAWQFYDEVMEPPPYIEPHSYFGYSMTSGNFFGQKNQLLFAVGAPRDENCGKVYIVTTVPKDYKDYILQSKKGFEVGEYFGASVLGVDLNGDSLTDLLVGAPLYANDTGCDEGKVYVYISDGEELIFSTELTGDGKADARFGTALANIGDLNQDGFNDIAVGAPYEDGRGAVYIYLGSQTGILSQYSQKIEAVELNPNLSGFGIHISRWLDIDDNGYPDILIGSYGSSNAVLLRSVPVIEVFHDLFFNPSNIKMSKAECLYEGKNLPCVHVDACLNYTGKMVPSSLDFLCTLTEEDLNPRGFFMPYRYKNAAAQRNVSVKYNTEMCFTVQFYLHSDIKDVITPISIQFACQLSPSNAPNDTFDNSYPVVSPFSIQNVTKEIPFHSGCADNDVCYSDLVVNAEWLGLMKNNTITLGNETSVSLDITVRNDGEPAYLSELLIYIHPVVPVIKKEFCEIRTEPETEVIACDLGNPLYKGKLVNFQIKLDVMKIPFGTNFVAVSLQATTNSSDVDQSNNVLRLALEVQTASDIGIRGIPSHSLILYHESEAMSSVINHKYTVRNYGPSPLQTIDIFLQVPNAILSSGGRIPFLFFTGLQTDSQSEMTVSAVCNHTLLDIERFQTPVKYPSVIEDENYTFIYENHSVSSNYIVKRDTRGNSAESVVTFESESIISRDSLQKEKRILQISCDNENIECVSLQCSASPFTDLRKFAQVSVAFEIDFAVLQDYFESWYQIEFITTGSISVSDANVINLPGRSDITHVKTVFLDVKYSNGEIPQWLYYAGFSIGLIVLILLVIILLKVGFFKRKERVVLTRLKQSFYAANVDEELLIDPCETPDVSDDGLQQEENK